MFDPARLRKPAEFERARRLRADGWPVRAIAREVGVSQSTISLWVRDVELPAGCLDANRRRGASKRGKACRQRHRSARLAYQREGRQAAREGDPLHLIGCMLYWAEGSKDRNALAFANSDPAMMETFVRFLRHCFDLTSDDLTFRINAYTENDMTIDEIELFWIQHLDLNPQCARGHVVNHFPTSSSGKRPRKLPYGVCTVKVKRSTRILQHIYGAIQEYSGVDRPEWLDGPPRKRRAAESARDTTAEEVA